MPAASVRNDLRILKRRAAVIGLQEFRHPWYWTVLAALFGQGWRSSPSPATGLAQPVFGGQGILWRSKHLRRITQLCIPAFDFDEDNSGIMENRWMRAVLLEDRRSELQCWYASTHFVVGGDEDGDGPRRKQFMAENLSRLNTLLDRMRRSGEPIVLELDANIHRGTEAYDDLMRIIGRHHGSTVGELGVEYLAIFPGFHSRVVVDRAYVLEPKQYGLNTDHEVRCIDHHLEKP